MPLAVWEQIGAGSPGTGVAGITSLAIRGDVWGGSGRVVLVYHIPEWWPWAPCALQDEAECSPLDFSCQTQGCRHSTMPSCLPSSALCLEPSKL